jgi:hypothetical protein
MATKTMPTHVRGSAEDRARAEITMWELDYEMEERSDISLRWERRRKIRPLNRDGHRFCGGVKSGHVVC